MLFLRILRGLAVLIVSCIMFAMISTLAILGYRLYQTRTVDSFVPDSFVELLQGPTQVQDTWSEEQGEPATEEEGIVNRLPTLPELTGPLPVGRWECFMGQYDFERNRKTNQPKSIYRCELIREGYVLKPSNYGMEFRADYSGYLLAVDDPLYSGSRSAIDSGQGVKLINSPFVYAYLDEFRWGWDENQLVLQTEKEYSYCFSVVNDNVITIFVDCRFMSSEYISQAVTQYSFVRVGSPEYILLHRYRECIQVNKGRNLWEVKECQVPF